ncbi:MAG TPA: hypothetical protein VL633_13430 [Bacteroidota bacterium]|jgi:hypothetical protein|nr:hypothetical protein [Bacteroidota bacterium]
MDEKGFTLLEQSILDWIARKTSDSALRSQIENAVPIHREYTGVGWLVDIEVPEPRTRLEANVKNPIDGPCIRSPQIEHRGGSIVFHEHGVITLLELYSYGDRFEKELIRYELYD